MFLDKRGLSMKSSTKLTQEKFMQAFNVSSLEELRQTTWNSYNRDKLKGSNMNDQTELFIAGLPEK